MSAPIPVKNIYYLLAYAWDKLPESEVTDVASLDSTELADLFAAVLTNGIHHLLRRGLDQAYIAQDGELAGVRGRIDVATTARRMLISHGRTHCNYDELRVDTLPNQILRGTVRLLMAAKHLDGELKRGLIGLDRELHGISPISVSRRTFRRIQLHGNNRYYRFLLSVCELIVEMRLMDESPGEFSFRNFVRDERAMARLFESFIFNFFRIERPDLSVRTERIQWQAKSDGDPDLHFLPSMLTDISIRNRPHTRTLIIDAKFYKDTFQKHHGKDSVHSANLYQIFSYLKNLEPRGGADALADGMLLYPTIETPVRLSYEIHEHQVEIRTINLAADWREIKSELNSLVTF